MGIKIKYMLAAFPSLYLQRFQLLSPSFFIEFMFGLQGMKEKKRNEKGKKNGEKMEKERDSFVVWYGKKLRKKI